MLAVDDYSYAPYRSRYSAEESSAAVYEKDQRHRRWLGRYDHVAFHLRKYAFLHDLTTVQYISLRRKRRFKRILLSVAFVVVVGVVTRVYLFFNGSEMHPLLGRWEIKTKREVGYNKASYDSYGFFNRISDDDWNKMKQESMTSIGVQTSKTEKTSHLLSESGANIDSNKWWIDNWEVRFPYIHRYQIRRTNFIVNLPTKIAG